MFGCHKLNKATLSDLNKIEKPSWTMWGIGIAITLVVVGIIGAIANRALVKLTQQEQQG